MSDERSPQGPSFRVLVVDDDALTRGALLRTLARLGHEVLAASDGAEALRVATSATPEVVLTDLRMPVMDGHTLMRRLQAAGVRAPVVVMSAQGTMDDVVVALRNGAVDYLKKPWTMSAVVAALERAAESLRSGGGTPDAAPASAAPAPTGGPVDLAALVGDLRRGAAQLPVLPAALGELRHALRDPDTTLDDVASLVERDARLATQLLRIANSAQGPVARCTTVRSAVGLVGLRQIGALVEALVARDGFVVTDPVLLDLHVRVWRHSLARAVAMRGLADLTAGRAGVVPDTAYLAGLLADVGASWLLWTLDRAPSPRPAAWLEGVRAHHAEAGAAIVRAWQLDPAAGVVAVHHHLKTPPAPPNPYWGLAVLGESLADELVGPDPTRSVPQDEATVERCAVEHRIGITAMRKVTRSLAEEIQGILEGLG